MDFTVKTMDFTVKTMNFTVKTMDFVLKIRWMALCRIIDGHQWQCGSITLLDDCLPHTGISNLFPELSIENRTVCGILPSHSPSFFHQTFQEIW